jgi:hypothetical protein
LVSIGFESQNRATPYDPAREEELIPALEATKLEATKDPWVTTGSAFARREESFIICTSEDFGSGRRLHAAQDRQGGQHSNQNNSGSLRLSIQTTSCTVALYHPAAGPETETRPMQLHRHNRLDYCRCQNSRLHCRLLQMVIVIDYQCPLLPIGSQGLPSHADHGMHLALKTLERDLDFALLFEWKTDQFSERESAIVFLVSACPISSTRPSTCE